MSEDKTKEPMMIEMSEEQQKAMVKARLDLEIEIHKQEWLDRPSQMQMEELRSPTIRKALIELGIVDKDDPRVTQIIQEEKDALQYMMKQRGSKLA